MVRPIGSLSSLAGASSQKIAAYQKLVVISNPPRLASTLSGKTSSAAGSIIRLSIMKLIHFVLLKAVTVAPVSAIDTLMRTEDY